MCRASAIAHGREIFRLAVTISERGHLDGARKAVWRDFVAARSLPTIEAC